MEPVLGTPVCLICFKSIQKRIFVPSDGPAKIFSNCVTYLHSTLTKETLQDIQLNNDNQLPLCKSCFDSALALTQLSEQLTTIQKDISDLTVAFSMAVFHRRSQVYSFNQLQNNSQNFSNSSTVEFNEACLPPNLFSNKNDDQNTPQSKSNHDKVVNSYSLHSSTDIITNVNFESNQCMQPTYEQNTNISAGRERVIPHPECENDSRNCTDGDNEMEVTMSDLMKSVNMPEIKLERIEIENNKVEISLVNSFHSIRVEPRQKLNNGTLFMNDELSDPPQTLSSAGSEKRRKRFHFGKIITRESKRNINRRTGIKKDRPFKCSFCQKKFSSQSIVASHERIHTGERPFKCSFCENRYRTSTAVSSHEKTHTGEKPYQCTICRRRFSHSSNLTRHEKTHIGEKHFKCSHCEKMFANIPDRIVHEKSHTVSANNEHTNDDFIVGI